MVYLPVGSVGEPGKDMVLVDLDSPNVTGEIEEDGRLCR